MRQPSLVGAGVPLALADGLAGLAAAVGPADTAAPLAILDEAPAGGVGPRRIIVKNVPPSVAVDTLRGHFEWFGPICAAKVISSQGPIGSFIAIITFCSASGARAAVEWRGHWVAQARVSVEFTACGRERREGR